MHGQDGAILIRSPFGERKGDLSMFKIQLPIFAPGMNFKRESTRPLKK